MRRDRDRIFLNKSRNSSKKVPYALSSKPQRYGPGKNRAIINLVKEVSASSVGRFTVHGLLKGNEEFSKKKELFKFFKIIEIRATFLPANIQGSFNNIAVLMSWALTQVTTTEMYQDDATKLVPVYRTRPRTLRFLPPRTVLDVQAASAQVPEKFLDLSQFLPTDTTINFPGWLYVNNTSDKTLFFNFEAVVIFRGNDNQSTPSKYILEENPFIDKILSKEQFDAENPEHPLDDVVEDDLEDIDSDKEVQPTWSKDYKISRIEQLKKEIEKLQLELKQPEEDQKEEEKEKIKETFKAFTEQKEMMKDFKEENFSRKNKPK